jgi:NAD-dependent oxidoreductase involved in siderophore biosynthesis
VVRWRVVWRRCEGGGMQRSRRALLKRKAAAAAVRLLRLACRRLLGRPAPAQPPRRSRERSTRYDFVLAFAESIFDRSCLVGGCVVVRTVVGEDGRSLNRPNVNRNITRLQHRSIYARFISEF